jgi:hypothetical protein
MRLENLTSQRAAKHIACYEQMVTAGGDSDILDGQAPHRMASSERDGPCSTSTTS